MGLGGKRENQKINIRKKKKKFIFFGELFSKARRGLKVLFWAKRAPTSPPDQSGVKVARRQPPKKAKILPKSPPPKEKPAGVKKNPLVGRPKSKN